MVPQDWQVLKEALACIQVNKEGLREIFEGLYTTRSMRRLKPDPIAYAVQARILDAAIRVPTINQEWRFLVVDDAAITAQLARLYQQAFERMGGGRLGEALADLLTADTPMGRTVRSGLHLAHHCADVPLLLIGFGCSRAGSGSYPALWSGMLAARAEGIGATLTRMLQRFFADRCVTSSGCRRAPAGPRTGAFRWAFQPVRGGRCSCTGPRGRATQ